MSVTDQIRSFARPVELLAPAGRWEALEAVADAGADAVYLGLKTMNMRVHRSDFNFTESQVADAVALLHDRGKHLYVTLNTLLCEGELDEMRDTLLCLAELGVDAVIVQDLATVNLVSDLSLDLALHASTMMNVHHAEQARALKGLGISRIITSRDIDIRTAGEIGQISGIEVEYFVHGDMCVAQSGQCSMSGVLFGKSANRGECMKPCRWDYELVTLQDGQPLGQVAGGHLLAIKDLCLLRNVPDLIQAGICTLKIEGRMRDAPYLRDLVAVYRETIDLYYERPTNFSMTVEAAERTFHRQVRQLSTLTTLGGSSHRGMFDVSGRGEPLFLGNGHAESDNDQAFLQQVPDATANEHYSHRVELAVCVVDPEAARTAIRAGADRVYLAAEVSQLDGGSWSAQAVTELIETAHENSAKIGMRTPRITTQREWAETQWILKKLADQSLDYILAHHLGTLRLAREICPDSRVIADYGFNVLNSETIRVLERLGAVAVTYSNEGGLADLVALAENTTLPLEILAHGPVFGMLLDHCLIALNASPLGRKDVCRGPCRHMAFGLRDHAGDVRQIIADQHCRNHLLTSHDLAILPRLDAFLLPAVDSIRIEGQFYSSPWLRTVVSAYRARLDELATIRADERERGPDSWTKLFRDSPRPLNFGPYARSLTQSRSTAKVMQELKR